MAEQKSSQNQQPVSGKKEFLRREEIVTMQKEISKIQEEEAKKEREKISALRSEKELEKPARIGYAEGVAGGEKIRLEEALKLQEAREKALAEEKQAEIARPPASSLAGEVGRGKKIAEEKAAELAKKETEAPVFIAKATQKIPEADNRKTIEEKKIKIGEEFQKLYAQKQPLRQRKDLLLEEIRKLKTNLAPIVKREDAAELKKGEIEERERKTVLTGKKRETEQERWEAEKQIEAIEKERWSIEENIENIEIEIKQLDAQYQKISDKEKELEKQKHDLLQKEKELELRDEYSGIEADLALLMNDKNPLEEKRTATLEKKNLLMAALQEIANAEKVIEEEAGQIQEREKSAASPQEKRKIEMTRWEIEKTRAELERDRWSAENEKSNTNLQLREIESAYQELAKKEERLKKRLGEIESHIGPIAAPAPQAPQKTAETKEEEKIAETPKVVQEKIETWTKAEAPGEVIAAPVPSGREEKITQMGTPRTKLEAMKEKEEAERKRFLERVRETEKTGQILPKESIQKERPISAAVAIPVKKHSLAKKIFVRIALTTIILGLLFLLAAFIYYYFIIR